MQKITGEDYNIQYDSESVTVSFQGEISFGGPAEYAPINQLLDTVAAADPSTMTLNLKELEFLNSAGISMLAKFVINMRKKGTVQVIVLGSNHIPWQGKSLKNLQRLLPSLKLELSA
ncbi:MAG: hypothetical protein F6K19_15045 [Cyanothece sp. SIO1E1]|nr:hypothetical protein [Cyanothece sp. SIO1E1]